MDISFILRPIAYLLLSIATLLTPANAEEVPGRLIISQQSAPLNPNDLRNDIESQKAREALRQSIEDIQRRVQQADRDVQYIRTVRAKLKDFLDAKECVGAQEYFKSLDVRQASVGTLASDLATECASANEATPTNLRTICREERAKLDQELADVKKARARFGELCPGLGY